MSVPLLDQIRTACREVAEHAVHVRINHDRLPTYAESLPTNRITQPELDPAHHYLGDDDQTAAFFLTLDAINFGSGYFPHLQKRPGLSGYFTVATALTEHFRRHGPLSAEDLASMSADRCAAILGQDLTNPPIAELMTLFARALGDLGSYLLERFDGSFVRLVEAANARAERLVQLLREMPLFNDVQHHGPQEVPFFKRAQLTAADLSLAFGGRGLGRFTDLDRLTIFADNLVPHVLRVDGVLRYPDDLLAQIARQELIPAGSPAEIEIRACALHAVELIGNHLRRSGARVTSMSLDYVLWNRGQQPAYKAIPRHRTRTVYY